MLSANLASVQATRRSTSFNTQWGKDAGFYKQIDRQAYIGLKLGDYMAALTEQVLNPYLSQLESRA